MTYHTIPYIEKRAEGVAVVLVSDPGGCLAPAIGVDYTAIPMLPLAYNLHMARV